MPTRRALIVLLAVCALMPQKANAADWIRLRSANFTFEGNVGEQDLRAVAQRLEQFHTVFALMFPSAKLVTPTPVTVLVFRRAGDIKTVAPRFGGKPVELAGFAASGTMGDSISICLEYRDQAYSVAYHEYAHLLIRNALWSLPLWLNEGLAEYYSRFEMSEDGTKAILGRPLSESYIELLRTHLLPVSEILAADEGSKLYNVDVGVDRQLFYGESWLLVHYMLHGSPDRKREFEDFVRRLTAGLPAAAAFDAAFPYPERLGTELSAYVHQPALRASGVVFNDRLAGASDFTVTRMTPAEAEASIGLELVRQRRLDEAKPHLETAARAPQTAAAQTGLGLILALQGKTLEALPALRKGAELADDNAMAHYALGYVALQCKTPDCLPAQGGSEAAAREFQRAVALVPRFPEALMYLGHAEEAGGHLDAAERHILEAVAMLPGREDYRLKAGEIYIRQENEAKAQEMLGPIAAASPNEPSKVRARALLGNLATLRVRREANAAGQPAAAQLSDKDWAKCERADPAAKLDGCEAVIKAGAEASRLVTAHMNRGSAAQQLNKQDIAVASFTEALKLDPRLAEAYVDRGLSYFLTVQYDKAIADLDEALRLQPQARHVICQRGTVYLEKRDYDRALADLNACVAQNPAEPASYLNRGIVYERINQFEKAVADYDQALRLKPNWIEAIGGRAGAFRKSGQFKKAIAEYDKYISLNPAEPLAFYGRGFAKVLKGDFAGVAADYGRYLETAPSSSSNRFYAALWIHLARQRLGQDNAVNLAAQAAKLDLSKWPGPVLKFYLGWMTAAEMRAAAADPDAEKRKGEVCEANFYEGERALWRGETAAAVPLLLAARDGCPTSYYEYDAAVAELGRLTVK